MLPPPVHPRPSPPLPIASPPKFQGDITSSDLVNFVLEAEKVDTIMHFAAQTHVGEYGRVGGSFYGLCSSGLTV